MFSNQNAEVSLNAPTRTLEALRGDKVESRFISGSCGLDSHQLSLLRFDSDHNQLRNEVVFDHSKGSISSIATSPSDASMLLTTTGNSASATLWKIPAESLEVSHNPIYDEDAEDEEYAVIEQGSLEERSNINSDSTIVDIKWRGGPEDDHSSSMGDVLTLDDQGNLKQWDVAFGAAESTRKILPDVSESDWNLPARLAWDPHCADTAAIATGMSLTLIDWRERDTSESKRFSCHRYGITSLDYNPNKPHILVTAGQEGSLKFWDLRSHKQPLLTIRGGHRHWASSVNYNPFHDQLVLSAGTDSVVNLWRISTISSAPLLTLDGEDDNDPDLSSSSPNLCVCRHEHVDAVYATTWGAADAWIYASASYDGKIVVNHVPSNEKYKILL